MPDALNQQRSTQIMGKTLKEEEENYERLSILCVLISRKNLQCDKSASNSSPQAAPHFVGSWEREIHSIKTALYIILNSQSIKKEVCQTVLVEVGSIPNAKPVIYV